MREEVVILKSRLSKRGGLEKYAMRTAQAFAAKDISVSILTTDYEEGKDHAVQHPGVQIIDLGTTSSVSYLHLKQFDKMCAQWISKHYPQTIIGMDRNIYQTHYRTGNGVHASYLERRCLTESRLKQLSFKINPLHRLILDMEKLAFENPRLKTLFTNSHMVKNEILQHYKVVPDKIKVIHNGVEWKEMEPHFDAWRVQKPLICEKLQLDKDLFQLLFIGNGYRRKGLQYLLEALSSVKQRDFQLSIVGNDKEEGYFKQMAAALNLEHQIKFFGPRGDVIRFYQCADALVIPSTYDPFANVTVEALAMGLFVVSSPYNGGSEILTSENGIVIQNLFDREAVIAALDVAFQHPKDETSARQMRQSVAHLDFSEQMDKFLQIILMD